MSGDDTAATVAKRKNLEADLAAARKELENSYYSHAMSERENALDKEFSDFEESKNKEIEKWEDYANDTERIVSDTLDYVKSNTNEVFNTLKDLGNEYNLTMSDSLITPWENGSNAIDSYSENFGTAVSNFTDQLDNIVLHWNDVQTAAEEAAAAQAKALQAQYNKTASGVPSTINGSNNSNNKPSSSTSTTKPATSTQKTITVGGRINAGNARIYADSYGGGGGRQYYSSDPIYTVLQERNGYLLVRHHSLSSGWTGWFKKGDVKAYAKGTKGVKENGLSLIDELGEELVVHSQNGKLAYLSKGTGVVPADLTEKLMDIALDPTSIFDDIKTNVKVPNVETKDFNFDLSFDSLLHIDNATKDSVPELKKMIRNEFNDMMSQVNNRLKRV